MGTYLGYNLKIDGVTVPNAAIVPGSYIQTPEKRIRSERTDANGIHHFKYHNSLRHKITFTLKKRTKAEHDSIKAAFAFRNGVTVKFWSEDDDDYLTGTFEMDAPAWGHQCDGVTFYYSETPIVLTEH